MLRCIYLLFRLFVLSAVFRECMLHPLCSEGKQNLATSEHVPQKQYPPGANHEGLHRSESKNTHLNALCNEKCEISST